MSVSMSHHVPTPGLHTQEQQTYDQLYDKARQFVGFMAGRILAPKFEVGEEEANSSFGGSQAVYDQMNLLSQECYGEALSYDPCFHPFIAEVAQHLIEIQERANG